MRKLLSSSWVAVLAIGCGGVTGPPAPRLIPGGGVADGKVDGHLYVHVTDEETREVISGASVRVGGPADATPCVLLTDAEGLAKFEADTCPGLKGPVTVTVSLTGHATVTWIGVNGTNLTIPIRDTNPPPVATAKVSGMISGWAALPVPPANHQTLALIGASSSDRLGDRADNLPQGMRNVVVNGAAYPVASNVCVLNASVSDCNWTLTTRTGAQAHVALIVDQDTKGTAADADDTFTFTGLAIKTGLSFAANDVATGETLTMLADADLQTFTASFAPLPSGMDYMGGFPALELGEDGRIGFTLPALDMTHTTTRVPKLTGALAGAHYSLIAQAQGSQAQKRPSSLAWLRNVDVASTVALSSWLAPPSSVQWASGTYSFGAVAAATVHGGEIQNKADGTRVWSITIFDGSTSFSLPALSPDPLPAGTLTFEASGLQIPGVDLGNFELDDARDKITGISNSAVDFAH
jgi:hypothetical protein